MFNEPIGCTKATDTLCTDYFQDMIPSRVWNNDVSFVSTARCLLIDRIKDNDILRIKSSRRASIMDSVVMFDQITKEEHKDSITIYDVARIEDGDALNKIKEQMSGIGYVTLDKITLFYMKVMKVLCFVNKENRSTILFVEELNGNHKKWHYLQCAFFAYVPWYFDPAVDKISPEENELMNSLKESDPIRYMNAVDVIMSKRDFRTETLKKYLLNFETSGLRQSLNSQLSDFMNIVSKINRLQDEICELITIKDEKDTMICGLRQKISNPERANNEMFKFFAENENLIFENVNGAELRFVVKGYLTSYDEERAASEVDDEYSIFYRGDSTLSKDEKKMLLRSIFLDKTIKMKLCGAYSILMGGGVSCFSNYEYPLSCADSMPNPHIHNHRCMGEYRTDANYLISNNQDYVGALEQCIMSVSNVNLGESATTEYFFPQLWETGNRSNNSALSRKPNNRCLELPDGRVVTAIEAVEWLKSLKEGVIDSGESN